MQKYHKYIFENSSRAIDVCEVSGLIIDMNKASEDLWKISKEKLIYKQNFFDLIRVKQDQKLLNAIKVSIETQEIQNIELYQTYNDLGNSKWVTTRILPISSNNDGVITQFIVINDDKTNKMRREYEADVLRSYSEMGRDILQILNEPENFQTSVNRILDLLKHYTGFDSIGIRLQKDIGFPYYAHIGFSDTFIEKEDILNHLECTCGLVLSGRESKFLTPGGSFWSNNTQELLSLSRDEDPRSKPRNTCIYEGYQSLALVPIRSKEEIVGLIHFANKAKDCFTMSIIELLESIASNIGTALQRKQIEEDLQKASFIQDALYQELVYKNHVFESLTTVSQVLLECNDPENLNQVLQIIGETLNTSRVFIYEISPLNILNCKYEYTNIRSIKDIVNNKDIKDLCLNIEDLKNKKVIIVNDTRSLCNNIYGDIKAFLLFSIFINNKLYGFIGLSQQEPRIWKQYEISILKNLSNLVGSFIRKCYYEKRLDKFIYDQSIILNNLDSYVWFFRDENTYGFINEKYYFEFVERQDLNKPHTSTYKDDCFLDDCHLKEESEQQKETNKQVFSENRIVTYKQWLTNNSNERRLLHIKKIPVINEDNNYIVCIAEDITDQYHLEKEMINSFKEIFDEKTAIIDQNLSQIKQTLNDSREIVDTHLNKIM